MSRPETFAAQLEPALPHSLVHLAAVWNTGFPAGITGAVTDRIPTGFPAGVSGPVSNWIRTSSLPSRIPDKQTDQRPGIVVCIWQKAIYSWSGLNGQ